MLWNRVSQEKLLNGNQFARKLKRYFKNRPVAIDTKHRKLKSSTSTTRRWLDTKGKPKRKLSHILKNHIRVSKRQKIGEVSGMAGVVDTTDRISDLPEHVIHKIISLLPSKDAARSSGLSKRWRSMWYSFPTFDLDQRSFPAGDEGKEKFMFFVEDTLFTRLHPLISIQKFRLYITSFDNSLASRMNSWVNAAIKKDVRELEIHVEVKKMRRYSLPSSVLMAKTATSLKLYGCMLDNYNDINLPNLKELSIKDAYVEVDVIKFFVNSCPLIEDLRLIFCKGLKNLQISSLLKLSRIEIHECHGLKSVDVKLPNLQSFWFHGKRSNGQCKINLEGCDDLKALTLKDTYMTDELFQALISKFMVLEKLVLKECNYIKRITILSGKLKVLVLLRCQKLVEAIIDAPNLLSFEYTGDQMPFSTMNISSLQELKICFENIHRRKSQIAVADEVQKFLAKFDQTKGLKLIVSADKNVVIYEELRELQLSSYKYFKIEIIKSSFRLKDHFDGMLRASFPKKLFVVSSPNSELLKFVQEKIIKPEEVMLSCCRYYSRKCWRHYLKHVETIHGSEESHDISSWNPCGTFPSTQHQTTAFLLEWESAIRSCIICNKCTDHIKTDD